MPNPVPRYPTALPRRRFLKLAGATLTMPLWLEQWTREALAQSTTPPSRAIFFFMPDGCIPSRWHPTGSESNFAMNDMTAPLEAVREHCVFLQGLDMYEGGPTHEGGVRKVLTGNAPRSLDTHLAGVLGAESAFSSLYLGVAANHENGSGGFSFLEGSVAQTPEDNPLNAFNRLFGDGAPAPPPAGGSVLDVPLAEISALQARLGTIEQAKLDQHLEALREVERRLQASSAACDVSGFNASGFAVPDGWHGYPPVYNRDENFPTVGELQSEVALLALSCGLTNVVSLQWSHPVSPTRMAWTGASQIHHDASHFGSPQSATAEEFVLLQRWYCERFATLVQGLEARGLLDSTLVLLFSELGDSNAHDHRNMPFVLAGGDGSRIPKNRLLQFDGEAHSKLLVAIAQALGSPIETFGYTGHGTGALPGLLA